MSKTDKLKLAENQLPSGLDKKMFSAMTRTLVFFLLMTSALVVGNSAEAKEPTAKELTALKSLRKDIISYKEAKKLLESNDPYMKLYRLCARYAKGVKKSNSVAKTNFNSKCTEDKLPNKPKIKGKGNGKKKKKKKDKSKLPKPICGNGKVEKGEECDDGNKINEDACTNACKNAVCRDNIVQTGVEECDDGNDVDTDACTNECKNAVCGDNIVQTDVEECDDGNLIDGDGCSGKCENEATHCNGIVEKGEECDDGNKDNTDACTNKGKKAKCGDGHIWKGNELCDDGNLIDGDGCSGECENESEKWNWMKSNWELLLELLGLAAIAAYFGINRNRKKLVQAMQNRNDEMIKKLGDHDDADEAEIKELQEELLGREKIEPWSIPLINKKTGLRTGGFNIAKTHKTYRDEQKISKRIREQLFKAEISRLRKEGKM